MTAVTNPASSGPAGPHFEGQIAAYYLLSLLTGAQPRGLVGTRILRVELQRASEGHPLDDVIVHAESPQGIAATLAIQVKRSIKFSKNDPVFRAVVAQIADTAGQERFWSSRYELAIAIARTSHQIDGPYQDVLAWARELGAANTFFARLARPRAANDDMRRFVQTFREHLIAHGAPSDDETVWQLLRRLQILHFDFTAVGSATEVLVTERAAGALHPDEIAGAASLWNNLTELAIEIAAVGGDRTQDRLQEDIQQRSFRLAGQRSFSSARAALYEDAKLALAEIVDRVGSVVLMRQDRIDAVHRALDAGRYVEIRGEAGVGKSAVLKHLAERIAKEAHVIVLSPDRITPRGWSHMRARIGVDGSARDLLVDLAVDGGAVLLIDGLENFRDDEQKTARDLVLEASYVPGFSVVVTARRDFATDEPSWLPAEALDRLVRAPPVLIDELSDAEVDELVGAAPSLAEILAPNHPARDVTRNLYRLSRLLSRDETEPLPHTEIDMMEQWWRSADGRRDEGHRERARVLRTFAEQALERKQPLDAKDQSHTAVTALVRSQTLRDLDNDRVIFRHDVLREWAIASVLDASPDALKRLPLARPGPVWLARALELAARFILERDSDTARWRSLLDAVSAPQVHGSWRRSVLLASVRSEAAPRALARLSPVLLSEDAALLRELVRTVRAVEVVPAITVWTQVGLPVDKMPEGLKLPVGPTWPRLVLFLLAARKMLPAVAIPDVAEIFCDWCTGTLGSDALTAMILPCLYEWLREIEEGARADSAESSKPSFVTKLQWHQIRQLESSLRPTFLLFAKRVPDLASQYLKAQMTRQPDDPIVVEILKSSGALAEAAPDELARLTIHALIPKGERARHCADSRWGPFDSVDSLFAPASPAQGTFYTLLRHAPVHGLALVRGIVDYAIEFHSGGRPYGADAIRIPFETGWRVFPWQRSYFWSRDRAFHNGLTSALMALEAWSHGRLEAGETFESVLADVLGSADEVPAAYLLVAVDLILSHWPASREAAVPFLASPALLSLDLKRVAVHEMLLDSEALHPEPLGIVSLETLKRRPSRRITLDRMLDACAAEDCDDIRPLLRAKLEEAAVVLGAPPPESDLTDPSLMVRHALNLIDPANRRERCVTQPDGNIAHVFEYIPPESESRHFHALRETAAAGNRDVTTELALENILKNPERSSPELVAHAVAWAQRKQSNPYIEDDGLRRIRELAILTAATIAARDGTPELRATYTDWIKRTLSSELQAEAKAEAEAELRSSIHHGLRANALAIAFIGWVHLLKSGFADPADFRMLLQIAARENPAGADGYEISISHLAQWDVRSPRAVLRVALVACVRPFVLLKRQGNAASVERQYKEKLAAAVEAEMAWLLGQGGEPSWPHFPPEILRRPRGRRIGGNFNEPDAKVRSATLPEEWLNHQCAAIWVGAAAVLRQDADGLRQVLTQYWEWTINANGSGWPREAEVDNPPREWNRVYFEALAMHAAEGEFLDRALVSICELPDISFFDILTIFLRALDSVYFATEELSDEQAVNVRVTLAGRMMASSDWRRLRASRSDGIEVHIGPAVAVLFYNDFLAFSQQPPKCYLSPRHIDRIAGVLPTITMLASSSPCLFVALVTLSFLEVSPGPSHLTHILALSRAWLEAYPSDTTFWTGQGIGRRLCSVIDQAISADRSVVAADSVCRIELEAILAALVRLGVSEASILEDALTRE